MVKEIIQMMQTNRDFLQVIIMVIKKIKQQLIPQLIIEVNMDKIQEILELLVLIIDHQVIKLILEQALIVVLIIEYLLIKEIVILI